MSRTPSPTNSTYSYQDLVTRAKFSQPTVLLSRTPTKNGYPISPSKFESTRSPRKRMFSEIETPLTALEPSDQSITSPDNLNFTPARFFRCHARNQAKDDIKTQIWNCAFAPNPANPNETLPLVATCGGNSFCLIDTEKVQVIKKYTTKEEAETFYCLAWFTLPLDNLGLSQVNYLAAAGTSGHLYLSHPEANAVFEKFLATAKGVAIHSLIAHPSQHGTLICGTTDGRIIAWNVGSPRPPNYSTNPVIVFELRIPGGAVDNMLYWPESEILLGAGENGLFACRNFKIREAEIVKIKFFERTDAETVDSLVKINSSLAAAKQVLTGKIVIFAVVQLDFPPANQRQSSSRKSFSVLDIEPLAELDWSGTDNFYMNMGIQLNGNLLACGDDKGTVWLYDLSQFNPESPHNMKPSKMIYWPQKLKDSNLSAYQRSKLSKTEVVINRVAVSGDGQTLVVVTSSNLVGIYKLS